MAPELLLRSGKRTTEPALSRSWRLLQASTKLKCVKGACEIEDLKRRLTGTERTMGTRGCRMASAKMSGGA